MIGKADAAKLRQAIARIRGEGASDDVAAILQSDPVKLYVESWILPDLEKILARHDPNRRKIP